MAYHPLLGYLIPKELFYKNSSDAGADKKVHAFPEGYLSESERNSAAGVQTRLLLVQQSSAITLTARGHPPCLTLSIIRYVSRVKWSNPGKGVSPSSKPRCSSY